MRKGRCDEEPHLREHNGRRQYESSKGCNLDVKEERLRRLSVDKPSAVGKDLLQRTHDEVEDRANEGEADQKPAEQGDRRDNQSLPELVQVVQEGHLSWVGFSGGAQWFFVGWSTGQGKGLTP